MNKALLDTDIFSEITKGVNPTIAAHAATYRQAFGLYTISAVTFMEIVRGYQKTQLSRIKCPVDQQLYLNPVYAAFPCSRSFP